MQVKALSCKEEAKCGNDSETKVTSLGRSSGKMEFVLWSDKVLFFSEIMDVASSKLKGIRAIKVLSVQQLH